LPRLYFFIIKNITNDIQKNPQRTKSIQKGEIWQLPASKMKGPIFLRSDKNFGEQLTPIPLTKGLKNHENGSEKKTKEINKTIELTKNFIEIPNIKKNMNKVSKI